GRPGGHLLDRTGALEGDDARERQVEAEVERAGGERPVLTEAVDDPAGVARPLTLQDLQRVFGGAASVDDQRLLQLARERDVAAEYFRLGFARRMVVVVVEAHLTHGE